MVDAHGGGGEGLPDGTNNNPSIVDNPDTFLKRFRIVEKIGEGSYSEVVKCKNRESGSFVACKRLKRLYRSWGQVNDISEVTTLRTLTRHPHILQMLEIHYDVRLGKVSLVFEIMDMNLYEHIKDRKKILPETTVRLFMFQLLKALRHLHKYGVFHRDIKPENILLRMKSNVLKLADLGSVRGIYSQPPFTEYISTRWYRSPECLLTAGQYGFKMDIWAAGCVFYEILTLNPLFPGSSEIDQINRIHTIMGPPPQRTLQKFSKYAENDKGLCRTRNQQNRWDAMLKVVNEFSKNPKYYEEGKSKNFDWNTSGKDKGGLDRKLPSHISSGARDLVRQMLTYDPDGRPSSQRVMNHPYFNDVRDFKIPESEVIKAPILAVCGDEYGRTLTSYYYGHVDLKTLGDKKPPQRVKMQFSSSKQQQEELSASATSSPLLKGAMSPETPERIKNNKEVPTTKQAKVVTRSSHQENAKHKLTRITSSSQQNESPPKKTIKTDFKLPPPPIPIPLPSHVVVEGSSSGIRSNKDSHHQTDATTKIQQDINKNNVKTLSKVSKIPTRRLSSLPTNEPQITNTPDEDWTINKYPYSSVTKKSASTNKALQLPPFKLGVPQSNRSSEVLENSNKSTSTTSKEMRIAQILKNVPMLEDAHPQKAELNKNGTTTNNNIIRNLSKTSKILTRLGMIPTTTLNNTPDWTSKFYPDNATKTESKKQQPPKYLGVLASRSTAEEQEVLEIKATNLSKKESRTFQLLENAQIFKNAPMIDHHHRKEHPQNDKINGKINIAKNLSKTSRILTRLGIPNTTTTTGEWAQIRNMPEEDFTSKKHITKTASNNKPPLPPPKLPLLLGKKASHTEQVENKETRIAQILENAAEKQNQKKDQSNNKNNKNGTTMAIIPKGGGGSRSLQPKIFGVFNETEAIKRRAERIRAQLRDEVYCSSDDDIVSSMRQKLDILISERARQASDTSHALNDNVDEENDQGTHQHENRTKSLRPRRLQKKDTVMAMSNNNNNTNNITTVDVPSFSLAPKSIKHVVGDNNSTTNISNSTGRGGGGTKYGVAAAAYFENRQMQQGQTTLFSELPKRTNRQN